MHLKIRCIVSLVLQLKYSLTKVQNYATSFNSYVRNHRYMILTLFHKTILRQMGQLNGWCTSLAWAPSPFSAPTTTRPCDKDSLLYNKSPFVDWTVLDWVGFVEFVLRRGEGVGNHLFQCNGIPKEFFCLVVQLVCKALREIS